TKYGIYKHGCGFDNVLFSFSHDIYLVEVLKKNGCLIPEQYLNIIKYHSFYPFHKYGEYEFLADENDMKLKSLLKIFSENDLYTKNNNNKLNLKDIKPYYEDLI